MKKTIVMKTFQRQLLLLNGSQIQINFYY